jgi:hypothetical protein
MVTGAGLVTAGFALAASASGSLIFSPASGATTLRPAWSTTDGCPAGHQGSAQISEFNTNGTLASRVSPVVGNVTKAFSGTLDGQIGALLGVTDIKKGGTIKFEVGCYSLEGGTGSVEFVQAALVTLSSSGTSFTAKSSSPDPTGATVPVTVTVPPSTPARTSTPTGTPTSTSSPGTTGSGLPSGGPQTGAGGASLPGSGNDLLIALGATLLAGSAAAMGQAVRRGRGLPGNDRPSDAKPDGI